MKKVSNYFSLRFLFSVITVLITSVYFSFAQSQTFYWDEPRSVTQTNAQFPVVVNDGTDSYLFYELIEKTSEDAGNIWIYMQKKTPGSFEFSEARKISDTAFAFSGEIPDIYSVAVSSTGVIAVSAMLNDKSAAVFVSTDKGNSFVKRELGKVNNTVAGLRIFPTSKGGFALFASLGYKQLVEGTNNETYENFSFSLLFASSSDGLKWSGLESWTPSKEYSNPFLPYLYPLSSGDLVVFQATYEYETDDGHTRYSNQLYSSFSNDNLKTWSPAVMATGPMSVPSNSKFNYRQYDNQRPVISSFDGKYYIAWERTPYGSENANIWVSELSDKGIFKDTPDQITNTGDAHRPIFFNYGNKLSLSWFDNRRGVDSVYMAQKNGYMWDQTTLVTMNRDSHFAYPVISDGELSFVWQQYTTGKNKDSFASPQIFTLQRDHTVRVPSLKASGWTKGKRSTSENVKAGVVLPDDPSGIAGYSWIFTQDKNEEPPELLMNLADNLNISSKATADGEWYFKVRAKDYAGNWSTSASITYFRDTTPPGIPVISEFETDYLGFMPANTFAMNWGPSPDDDDVAGYSWNLVNVSSLDKNLNDTQRHPLKLSESDARKQIEKILERCNSKISKPQLPAARNSGNITEASYSNRLNGIYTFSVRAVDTVGNIGEAATVVVMLNKYLPVTVISGINKKVDDFGQVELKVVGRGFTYDGTVSEVYLDKDGKAPYDLVLKKGKDFRVASDELITGITINDFEEGQYRVGVLHTDRGIYFTKPIVTIDDFGTVKIETEYEYLPEWLPVTDSYEYHITSGEVFMWILAFLALLGFAGAARGLVVTARDAVIVKQEVRALLTGDYLPMEKKKIAALNKKGMSLKFKLRMFTTMLVLMIVLIVSIPLGLMMTRTQERTLAQGLENRVNVLMDSIGSSVRAYMPSKNDLEIGSLPSQTDNFDGAIYATIIGAPRNGKNTNLDYVWATNDREILNKIDTDSLKSGESRISDEAVQLITPRFDAIDKEAVTQVGELTSNINSLTSEALSLIGRTDSKSVARVAEINDNVSELTSNSTSKLNELGRKGAGSEPQFDTEHLDRNNTEYLFYKPVLYSTASDDKYVHAVVLVKVSTDSLIQEVDTATYTILVIAGVIALIAIVIGLFGSTIIASIIVKPIRMLEDHVKKIGETQDKEKLDGYEIEIKSRDEIRTLGDSINEMTRGLVKAAKDGKIAMEKEKMELDGKAVQQTFIPLNPNKEGRKETTAALKDDAVQFFGYYEGADAVSGDYFDYKKLDDRWYAIIKCDVSGHGVPAALIMTAVATQFRKYFESWSFKKDGIKLNELVTSINDFIESLGVKGKFATLMVCLFDTKTGDVYMCNAGDNIIHIYDAMDQVQKKITLHEAPAAGPLPSFMVEMKGGFKVEKTTLKKGDVLFLYTDGIEEATRFFRDSKYEVTQCHEPGLEEGQEHENHKVGQQSEQMEPERVKDIVESIFNRRPYELKKFHCPNPDEQLLFDFSKCDGTIEECILALAAVEKVFRLYKRPGASGTVYVSESGDVIRQGDTVRVDRKIDAFLKKTFNHYDKYCSDQMDMQESNYLYYVNINEDAQADDLTLLALQKN